jgi:hypothetical protein
MFHQNPQNPSESIKSTNSTGNYIFNYFLLIVHNNNIQEFREGELEQNHITNGTCSICNRESKNLSTVNGCQNCLCKACKLPLTMNPSNSFSDSCGVNCCSFLLYHLSDLKKQWYVFRCLNRSSNKLFSSRSIPPKPMIQFTSDLRIRRDFLKESNEELEFFIGNLANGNLS